MGNFDRSRGGSRDGRDRDRSGSRDGRDRGSQGRRPFDRNFNSGPREMHKATCSECKKECEVPFKPSKDSDGNPRPVYCRDCFQKKNPRR